MIHVCVEQRARDQPMPSVSLSYMTMVTRQASVLHHILLCQIEDPDKWTTTKPSRIF
jgi:hypothetical protein